MQLAQRIQEHLAELAAVLKKIDSEKLAQMTHKLQETMHAGNMIYIFGNGGCSSLASHFCADLGKMMKLERDENFRILSLNDNIPSITAWANDTGYENIFWRQLELFMRPGDLVFALSGSGNSKNVLEAVKYAREQGNPVLSFSGFDGGQLATMAELSYVVPSHNMQIVEDAFGILLHGIFVGLRDS
jgi:D-sedoheptulose 7-phosphate isomerase